VYQYKNEYDLTSLFDHPYITKVHEGFTNEQNPAGSVIVMELIDGETIGQFLIRTRGT